MPPELPNDQELSLKKRARRRLVGAIALVLLMVIILPMVLQDRVALAPKDAIKITMPEHVESVVEVSATQSLAAPVEATAMPTKVDAPNVLVKADGLDVEPKNVDHKNPIAEVAKKTAVKVEAQAEIKEAVQEKSASKVELNPAEAKTIEPKPVDAKATQKNSESFSIQVGVYSDLANVKQLQAKLKEAGFPSHTENITTPKGEKIRVKAGKFASRQDAADALERLKASGLPGMVISND